MTTALYLWGYHAIIVFQQHSFLHYSQPNHGISNVNSLGILKAKMFFLRKKEKKFRFWCSLILFALSCRLSTINSDFLKVNSFANQKILLDNFANTKWLETDKKLKKFHYWLFLWQFTFLSSKPHVLRNIRNYCVIAHEVVEKHLCFQNVMLWCTLIFLKSYIVLFTLYRVIQSGRTT